MTTVEVKVPDIGDFAEVEVIELLVKPGDAVKAEQSLITVESDKASMEIPSTHAGVVKELKVKIGDKVNEGSLVMMLEAAGGAAASSPLPPGEGQGGARPSPPPPRGGGGGGGAPRSRSLRLRPSPHPNPLPQAGEGVMRSTSSSPTSATSMKSPSSKCWSRPATRSRPNKA